ncbi:pyridoxal phosphate-dependent aminotransferase [Halosimplex amylolyticum]|uniref:pyridoxal phosphate-dependent aminotransferase n=1 Tax=Halosimplex amylolyticum TaxID=3396616 RepID=UPI003F565E61
MDYETPQFFRVMQYAARADRDVVDMVSGNPDWEPPEALRDGLREYADGDVTEFQYPPSVGLTPLRDEIAERRGVDRSRVLVTNGAGEANHLATTSALERGEGDAVIMTDPVYPYYAGRANLLDADSTYVPVDETGQVDPAGVREAATDDTAAIVVNSPNNPTGAVYPPQTIEALVELAEEYDAVLVSDEVYDHFDYTGTFESALATDSDHVVATNSFSKSMAITGFRVGYAVFPPEDGPLGELVERARTRHMIQNVTGSRPAQYAVLRALRETPVEYYERNRERIRERIDRFTDALDAAGAAYTTPGGSFYVMARFDGFPGTMENVERLIDEAGVAGMPGEAFGEARDDWLRFALVTPRVDEAAERLADYLG